MEIEDIISDEDNERIAGFIGNVTPTAIVTTKNETPGGSWLYVPIVDKEFLPIIGKEYGTLEECEKMYTTYAHKAGFDKGEERKQIEHNWDTRSEWIYNSMFGGTNQTIIDDEIARKKKKYDDNLELVQISKIYERQKIDFKIEFFVGPPKKAAVEASEKLKATWVILDRKIKKNKKYFLEKLSCGVSGLNRNEEIIKIRGPKKSTRVHNRELLYGKMLIKDDEDLFRIKFDSSYLLNATYESIEEATSIGCMVGNRGNSEIGSVDLSYDAPPSYNVIAPRARSQIDEYNGVSERFYGYGQHQY